MTWDLFITSALVFICTVLPFHIAFDYKSPEWCVTYLIIDAFFFIDIIIIFFTSIPATEFKDEVVDHVEIAKEYLGSWFVIDLLAIIPFDMTLNILAGDFALCADPDKKKPDDPNE
jgi:hypothetical protein